MYVLNLLVFSFQIAKLPLLLLIAFFIDCSHSATAQAFRASSTGTAASGVTTITINKPTGTAFGDVMVAAVAFRPDAAIITAPSGWTLVRRTYQSAGAPNSQAVYWKAAGEKEPSSFSWTFDTSTGAVGSILAFYDVNPVSPIHTEGAQATPGGLLHAAPSVNTAVNKTVLITAHSFGSSATWTPPSGMTEAVDIANLAVPNPGGVSMEVNYVVQEIAGSTGTKTATASGEDDTGVATIIALTPRSSTFNAVKTGSWGERATWVTSRYGTVSTSTGSTSVSGSGTLFTSDLVPGDFLYNSSFGLIGTIASIQSNTTLTLTGNALIGLSGAVYKSSSTPQSWDDAYIGISNGQTGITTTVDITEATCKTLTFESSNAAINYNLDIPAGKALKVSGASLLRLPSKAGANNTINVAGTFTAASLTLLSVTTGAGRVSQINISDGVVNIARDIAFSSNSNAKVNATGSGRLNIGGNFLNWISESSPPTDFATAATINFASTSAINFNGVDRQQTLLGIGTYGNVYFNNTGNNVATLNANVTTTNVQGDILLQSGTFTNQGAASVTSLNATSSAFTLTGNPGRAFRITNSGVLKLAGTSSLPTGFGTITLQPTSTVDYIGTMQAVPAQDYGNLTISAGASARTVTLSNTGTIGVFSSFSPSSTNTTYDITGSTIAFNGNLPQTMPTGFSTYHNLTIQNSNATLSSATVTLGGAITVKGALTLSRGFIVSTSTNILNMAAGSSTIGTSASSYVNGPMTKTGTTAFVFPVGYGNGTRWARIGIGAPTASTTFKAQYFAVPYSNTTSMATTPTPVLYDVSKEEYWDLDRTVGTGNATVTLYWEDAAWSGIDDCSNIDLRVAHWNGTAWENNNNETTTSGTCTGATSGFISTSAEVSSFSPFTFGSLSSTSNTLPVQLISFDASCLDSSVKITWATAMEINNQYFTVERSTDGMNYQSMATIEGAGNSSILLNYSFIDKEPLSANSYYRLKNTNTDGTYEYSKVVSATCKRIEPSIFLYPNPNNGKFVIVGAQNAEFVIVNTFGAEILDQKISAGIAEIDISNFPKGIYFVWINSKNKTKKLFRVSVL